MQSQKGNKTFSKKKGYKKNVDEHKEQEIY